MNNQGVIIIQKNYSKSKLGISQLQAEYDFTYDTFGNKITEVSKIREGKGDSISFLNEYDSRNRLIRTKKQAESSNRYLIKDSIIYSEKNQPISWKETSYNLDSDKQAICYIYNSYDSLGLLKKEVIKEPDGSYTNREYDYFKNGDLATVNIYQRSVLKKEQSSGLQSSNNVISGEKTIEYRYEYDNHYNWTKRYIKINGSKEYVDVIRRIKYR